MALPSKPFGSFLLLPDRRLTGRDSTQSASSQGGRVPGDGTPDAGNEGNLSLFASGDATDDAARFVCRVQDSGGIRNGATFAWKYEDEADTAYRGSNDARYLHFYEDPFVDIPASALSSWSSRYGYAAAAIYIPALRREVLYVNAESGEAFDLAVRYREVSYIETDWVDSSVTFSGGMDYAGQAATFAACVLSDGAVRAVVERSGDLDIYHSEDGIAFEIVADNILTRFYGEGPHTILNVRLAESGGYLRLVGAIYTSSTQFYLFTFVSSDRGASWRMVNDQTTNPILVDSSVGPISGRSRFNFDLAGFGDAGGTFIVSRLVGTSAVETLTATGAEPFRVSSDLALTMAVRGSVPDKIRGRIFLGRSSDYVSLLIAGITIGRGGTSFDNGEWSLLRLDRRIALEGQSWQNLTNKPSAGVSGLAPLNFTRFHNAGELPAIGSLYDVGHGLALFAGRYNYTLRSEVDGTVYCRIGDGWGRAPISDYSWEELYNRVSSHQPVGALFSAIEWIAANGNPGSSPWSVVTGGSPLALTHLGILQIVTGYSWTSSSFARYQYDTAAGKPKVSWGLSTSITENHGSVTVFECEVVTHDEPSPQSNPYIALRVQARSPASFSADEKVEVEVRIGKTSVTVRDRNSGSAKIAEIIPDTAVYGADPLMARWEYRLSLVPRPTSNPCLGILKCRKRGTEEWLSSDIFVPTRVSGVGSRQHLRFGHFQTGTNQVQSRWYSVALKEGGDLRQIATGSTDSRLRDQTYPEVVRGRECTPFPVALHYGVRASWGGGGGFDGDVYRSDRVFQYGARNAVLSSPSFEYRSETGSSPLSDSTITFNAGTNTLDRFSKHDGIAVFRSNVETITVEYDDDPTFPSPVAAGSLSLRRYADLRVEAVDGKRLQIAGAELPRDGEVSSSDAVDYFAHFVTIAGGTTVSNGDAFRILDQRGDGFECEAANLSTALVGSTISIYADRGVLLYSSEVSKRYLRLTLSQAGPPGGYHRLGTVVAGTTLPLDVPIDWDFTDSDRANATQYRSRSGISWAYIEGPSKRTIDGTVTGDAGRFRDRLRSVLRSTTRYADLSSVLVLDSEETGDFRSVVLGRILDGLDFDQTGWRYDEDRDEWHPVGNVSISFEEDV